MVTEEVELLHRWPMVVGHGDLVGITVGDPKLGRVPVGPDVVQVVGHEAVSMPAWAIAGSVRGDVGDLGREIDVAVHPPLWTIGTDDIHPDTLDDL